MGNNGPIVVSPERGLQIAGRDANVATARAEQAVEKSLNVDGKRINPKDIYTDTIFLKTSLKVGQGVILTDGSVQTNHIASGAVTTDKITAGAVMSSTISTGAVTSDKITVSNLADIASIFTGSVTVGTDSAPGVAATGLWLTSSQILMKNAGVTYLNFTPGTYFMKGEVVADKITINPNPANNVVFGSNVTINGHLTVDDDVGSYDRLIIFNDPIYGTKYTRAHAAMYEMRHAGTYGQLLLQCGPNGPTDVADSYLWLADFALVNVKPGQSIYLRVAGADVATLAATQVTVVPKKLSINGLCALVGPDGLTPLKVAHTRLSASVTGVGTYSTNLWTHGWNTSSQTVRFSATADYYSTGAVLIRDVRVFRISNTQVSVHFKCDSYVSSTTVYFDVVGIGPA